MLADFSRQLAHMVDSPQGFWFYFPDFGISEQALESDSRSLPSNKYVQERYSEFLKRLPYVLRWMLFVFGQVKQRAGLVLKVGCTHPGVYLRHLSALVDFGVAFGTAFAFQGSRRCRRLFHSTRETCYENLFS